MLKTTWKECHTCPWTVDFLERGNPKCKCLPVLVIRKRRLKMTWAMLVPRKGTEFLWIAKSAAKFIDQLGHNRATLRCDNEQAIEALARDRTSSPSGMSDRPERPPVEKVSLTGPSSVRWGSLLVRTLKAALEHRIAARVPPDARIWCWLVEFAAYLTCVKNPQRCCRQIHLTRNFSHALLHTIRCAYHTAWLKTSHPMCRQ